MSTELITLLSAPAFQPKSINPPFSWIGHLPFAYWLIAHSKPGTIVELGTHSGNSYFGFCQAVVDAGLSTRCFAVDLWHGDDHAGTYDEEIFEQVNRLNNSHFDSFSTLIRRSFDEAVQLFPDASIDLLHIDGLHTYDAVKHDFETWLPKLTFDAIVLFHDTAIRESGFGVWRYWQELQQEFPLTFEFDHSNGLGVLQLESSAQKNSLEFLFSNKEISGQIQKYFSDLGQHIIANTKASEEMTSLVKQLYYHVDLISQRDKQFVEFVEEQQKEQLKEQENFKILNDLNGRCEDLQNKLKQSEATISAINASTSWQVTRPLRYIGQLLKSTIQETRSIPSSQQPLSSCPPSMLPDNFDEQIYLQLNPDIAESGVDPVYHYCSAGQYEGRPYSLPAIKGEEHYNPELKTVLIVSHAATRTGAPVLVFNIAQQLSKSYNIVVLLLREGSLTELFCDSGVMVVVSTEHNETQLMLKYMHDRFAFSFALVNSIESRQVLPVLGRLFVPTVTLIHEFAANTRPKNAFNEAMFWSGEVVFSTALTWKDVRSAAPELGGCRVSILPQGRSVVPYANGAELLMEQETTKIRQLMRPSTLSDDVIVILGAGTVHLRKGVDLFIAVAEHLVHRLGFNKCRFVWIGSGYKCDVDTGYSVYLADQIARMELDDYIAIADETPAIDQAYREADVFLLTSRLDPLPNVAIDVMSLGVPFLCFDNTTGIADMLIQEQLGSLCVAPYLDSVSMAEKLHSLVSRPDIRKQLGEACKSLADKHFDMQQYVKNLEILAHKVADQTLNEERDTHLIHDSGCYQPDYSTSSRSRHIPVAEQVRAYVRSWVAQVGRHKPFPGFHPGIYQELNHLERGQEDPLAHYLRAGRPSGPWNYPLIVTDDADEPKLPEGHRVALHLHLYFPDLIGDILTRLASNRICPDLLISVPDERVGHVARSQIARHHGEIIDIQVVPNKGRDIGPFLTAFGQKILDKYDYVGHIHTKKTADIADSSVGAAWYRFLLEHLLGGVVPDMADRILSALHRDPKLGMVFPDDPSIIGWGKNRDIAEQLAKSLAIQELPEHPIFPLGTMFWARTSALRSLIELGLGWDDYPSEPLPYDGTMLHALERLFGLIPKQHGYYTAAATVKGITR